MLQGTLNDFTLADVFSLLALTKKTGALRVTAGGTDGQVLFREGLICLALSDAKRVPLGARLVSAGLIGEEQVRATVEQHAGSSVAVTEALLASGQVEDRVLGVYLREQIVDAVFELMRLDEGSFNFDASAPALSRGVGLSVIEVVGEANRRLDEWQAIGRRVASAHAVLAMVPSAASGREGVNLAAEQWELLALIDGRRTVTDVVELTGRGEFATCRVLGDLIDAGLVQAQDPAKDGQTDLDKLIAAREALRSLEQVDPSGIRPELSSAAPLTAGTSRIRWVEPPADAVAPTPIRPAVMASRTRTADTPAEPVPPASSVAPAAAPSKAETAPPPETAPKAELVAKTEASPAAAAAAPAQSDSRPATPRSAASAAPPPSTGRTEPTPLRSQPAATPAPQRDPAAGGVSSPPAADAEQSAVPSPSGVDRAQVARELASLGLDHDGPAGGSDENTALTRDGDVNKGLLLRLIDGVKGA